MTLNLLGLLACGLGIALILYANVVAYNLRDEVNHLGLAEHKIGEFFLQLKMEELLSRHRALVPGSSKPKQMYVLGVTGIALLFLGFVLFTLSGISPLGRGQ